jgi:hypothetical protein
MEDLRLARGQDAAMFQNPSFSEQNLVSASAFCSPSSSWLVEAFPELRGYEFYELHLYGVLGSPEARVLLALAKSFENRVAHSLDFIQNSSRIHRCELSWIRLQKEVDDDAMDE